jgi:hypothetical protein
MREWVAHVKSRVFEALMKHVQEGVAQQFPEAGRALEKLEKVHKVLVQPQVRDTLQVTTEASMILQGAENSDRAVSSSWKELGRGGPGAAHLNLSHWQMRASLTRQSLNDLFDSESDGPPGLEAQHHSDNSRGNVPVWWIAGHKAARYVFVRTLKLYSLALACLGVGRPLAG